jgi:hypothetical protein
MAQKILQVETFYSDENEWTSPFCKAQNSGYVLEGDIQLHYCNPLKSMKYPGERRKNGYPIEPKKMTGRQFLPKALPLIVENS